MLRRWRRRKSQRWIRCSSLDDWYRLSDCETCYIRLVSGHRDVMQLARCRRGRGRCLECTGSRLLNQRDAVSDSLVVIRRSVTHIDLMNGADVRWCRARGRSVVDWNLDDGLDQNLRRRRGNGRDGLGVQWCCCWFRIQGKHRQGCSEGGGERREVQMWRTEGDRTGRGHDGVDDGLGEYDGVEWRGLRQGRVDWRCCTRRGVGNRRGDDSLVGRSR